MPDLTRPEAQLLIVLGVVGGTTIGYYAYQHMFVEGLTAKERKNMLIFAAGTLAVWAANEFLDLEEYWYLTPETAAEKIEKALVP